MSDSSTLCFMNMIRRQSTVTFTFPLGLRNGIGSMSVPFSTVWRESGFALGACGKALPDHSSQWLPEAAVGRTSKRAHEIVQFLERERFFQNRGTRHKSKFMFWILLTNGINEFRAPGPRTA